MIKLHNPQSTIWSLRKPARLLEIQQQKFFHSAERRNKLLFRLLLANSHSTEDLLSSTIGKKNHAIQKNRDLTGALVNKGFDFNSLQNLLHLRDETILKRIPATKRPLKQQSAADLALYLNTWADHIEEHLLQYNLPVSERPTERFFALL